MVVVVVMVVVVEPLGMVVGVKLVITGAGTGVKVKPAILAVPSGVVTLTSPDCAATGTTAVIRVAELTTKLCAATPPKLTALAPVKLLPEITTLVPGVAVAGVKPVMTGAAGMKVKPTRFAVPPGVRTLTLPVAPPPTYAVMVESFTTTKRPAARPPKLTASVE